MKSLYVKEKALYTNHVIDTYFQVAKDGGSLSKKIKTYLKQTATLLGNRFEEI